MAKNRDYIWEINRKVLINSPVSKVWDIISSESHLEKFHPFCKKNESSHISLAILYMSMFIQVGGGMPETKKVI